jgi:hypothetical protein
MVWKSLTRGAFVLAAGAFLISVAGCGANDPEADKTARAAYGHFARGEDAAFVAMMEPGAAADSARANLAMLRQLVPPGPPPEGQAAGWSTYAGTSGVTTTLTHVYSSSDRDVTAKTTLIKQGDPPKWRVRAFNINVQLKAGAVPPVVAPGAKPADKSAPGPKKT